MIEMVFNFYEIVVFFKHCDPIWLKKFMNNVKSLIIIISWRGVFEGDDHKNVVNQHFDKLSFSHGRWQDMWHGLFLKFSFQIFFD
jgi:hypothetical protein